MLATPVDPAAPVYGKVCGRFNIDAVSFEGVPVGYVRHDTTSWVAFVDLPSISNPKPDGSGFASKDAAAAFLLSHYLNN